MSWADFAHIILLGSALFVAVFLIGLALKLAIGTILFLIISPPFVFVGVIFMALSFLISLPVYGMKLLRSQRPNLPKSPQLPENVLPFRRSGQAST